jgi:hypothetical protein
MDIQRIDSARVSLSSRSSLRAKSASTLSDEVAMRSPLDFLHTSTAASSVLGVGVSFMFLLVGECIVLLNYFTEVPSRPC